ncbi:MAG: Hpt domain-containing protein [Proteobacteria bacterium]|nr:Hpt domain-containing protein [Pseudomonadota bacterium]
MSQDDGFEDDFGDDGEPAFDPDPDMLARAEQAIASHSVEFRKTVRARIAEMSRLTGTLAAPAGTDIETGAWDALFRQGHELAGQGATFGFPLLSDIGRSLCGFIDARAGDTAGGDIAILRAHIAAVAQAIGENPPGPAERQAILASLQAPRRR